MENENFVPEIDLAVNLPQVPAVPQTQRSIETAIEEACSRHALDPDSQQRIKEVLTAAGATVATADVVDLLAKALRHDEDVSNAEASGYLRGRNEKIDNALKKPRSSDPPSPANFPRYVKQSIWD